MQPRLEFSRVSPDALEAMLGLEAFVARSGVERPLIELVKMRASQISGWNRISIGFRSVPGTYRPSHRAAVSNP